MGWRCEMVRAWMRAAGLIAVAALVSAATVVRGEQGYPVIQLEQEDLVLHGQGSIDGLLSKKRADAGDPDAQYLLALARYAGRTKLIDERRARAYLEASAAHGHARARVLLANVLRRGKPTAQDQQRAKALARAAAEQGDGAGMVVTAELLDRPAAPPGTAIEALSWYLLGAAQGMETSEAVAKLRARLDATQQARACERVFAWHAKHPKALRARLARPAAWTVRGAKRPTRVCKLVASPRGPQRATQVAGAPWWPAGTERPRCPKHRVPEAFIAQFKLADVPGMQGDETLVSLHVCSTCGMVGYTGDEPGYAVTLLPAVPGQRPDGRGRIDDLDAKGGTARFRDATDHMSIEDMWALPGGNPDAWPRAFDPYSYANAKARAGEYPMDVAHSFTTKVGGWPSWEQHAGWPKCKEGRRMTFVGQVDSDVSSGVMWGGGGFAYVFVCPKACKRRHGELVIQFS